MLLIVKCLSREAVERFREKDMRKQGTTAGRFNPNQRDLP
jgi:hypothetical protein